MKYLENKKIAVIGSGNMAGAMIGALLRNKELNPEQITASDPYPEQRERISKKYGITVTDDNCETIKNADIVILSVKPQVLAGVSSELKGKIPVNSLAFSIANAA